MMAAIQLGFWCFGLFAFVLGVSTSGDDGARLMASGAMMCAACAAYWANK
jgi:hypothetical protein